MRANTTPVSSTDKLWALLCHLSIFIGLPFIVPLVVYIFKKGQSNYVSGNAGEAVNFHLSTLLYFLLIFSFVFAFAGSGFKQAVIPVAFAIALGVRFYLMAIIAAVKSADGYIFHYSLTIPFLNGHRE